MLTFFVSPYPDESFYGILSRYHLRSGNRNNEDTLEELFNNSRPLIKILYPNNLHELCNNLLIKNIYNPDYFIKHHTIFPYIKPFLETDKINLLINSFIDGRQPPIRESELLVNKSIKVCKQCFRNDINIFGEPYFHRTHQIPGNYVCHLHNVILDEYILDDSVPKNKYLCVNEVVNNLRPFELPVSLHKELLIYSEDIQALIKTNTENYNSDVLRNSYIKRLKELGYTSINDGYFYQRQICLDFNKFYTREFLDFMNSTIDFTIRCNWVKRILSIGIKTPLKICCLLDFYLEVLKNFIYIMI